MRSRPTNPPLPQGFLPGPRGLGLPVHFGILSSTAPPPLPTRCRQPLWKAECPSHRYLCTNPQNLGAGWVKWVKWQVRKGANQFTRKQAGDPGSSGWAQRRHKGVSGAGGRQRRGGQRRAGQRGARPLQRRLELPVKECGQLLEAGKIRETVSPGASRRNRTLPTPHSEPKDTQFELL